MKTGIDANVSAAQVMQAVNEQLRPINVGTFTLDSKDSSITMAYQQPISTKEQLENINIQTQSGTKKLREIADLAESNAPVTVNHDGGKTYAKISGTIKDDASTSAVTKQVQQDIKSLALPEGVQVSFGGGLAMIKLKPYLRWFGHYGYRWTIHFDFTNSNRCPRNLFDDW
jgi:multidrug efflux pump subunit AcrB